MFNYITKKPTDGRLVRYLESFNSNAVFTEQFDFGGHTGPDNKLGYRQYRAWPGRNLRPGQLHQPHDVQSQLRLYFDTKTVIEAAQTLQTQMSRACRAHSPTTAIHTFIKAITNSLLRPRRTAARSSTTDQPGAGSMSQDTTSAFSNIKHEFDNGWKFEDWRSLLRTRFATSYGLTNGLTNNFGSYTTVQNFTAWPHL